MLKFRIGFNWPELLKHNVETKGIIVLGTVKTDLHDIGKNLVGLMLKSKGFEVIDLGVDVAPEKFVEAVKTYQPDYVCMSALLTTSMPSMKQTVEALIAAGLRDSVKICVGEHRSPWHIANKLVPIFMNPMR